MIVNIFSRYNPTFVSIDQCHTFFLFSLATSPSYDRLLLIFWTTGIRISHFIHNYYCISASLLNNFKLCWNWTCQKCSICKQVDNSSGEIFQIVNHRRFRNVNKQLIQKNKWTVVLYNFKQADNSNNEIFKLQTLRRFRNVNKIAVRYR